MPDVFMTTVRIHDVKPLKNLTIELSKSERRHLILTGKNSSGKTALLEAVHAFLADPQQRDGNGRPVVCEFNLAEGWREQFRQRASVLAFRRLSALAPFKQAAELKKCAGEMGSVQASSAPGHFGQYLANLQAERALAREAGDLETGGVLDRWLALVENAIQQIFADATLKIQFDCALVYLTQAAQGGEAHAGLTLSDGSCAALQILGDVLMSLDQQREKGSAQQGMVLIDNFEAFLDMALQEKLLPRLTHIFPNMQFLISTHSPIVLTSLENAVVYDLENRLRRENLPQSAEQAWSKCTAEINNYPEQIKRMLDEYEKLLRREHKTEQEEFRMTELRNYLTWIVQKLL